MPIEGIHTIEGRGTVATGKLEQGVITVGQKVEILGIPSRKRCTMPLVVIVARSRIQDTAVLYGKLRKTWQLDRTK